jgi:hypothetical protein
VAQVRVGDDVLLGGRDDVSLDPKRNILPVTRTFFTCADHLERTANDLHRKRLWLLVSDSKDLRAAADKMFASAMVPRKYAIVPRHTARDASLSLKVRRRAFEDAATEMWLFSLAIYHVVTANSSFGEVAAAWSRRDRHLFILNKETGAINEGRRDFMEGCRTPRLDD